MCHGACKYSYTRLLTTLTMALLVSSCAMVGPDFQKPESTVNAAWSDADEPVIATDSAEHREWWKNFNDPILDTLIQTAYEQSLTLQVAGLRVYEARAILGVAAGTLYPQSQSAGASAATIELSENAEPISNLPPAIGAVWSRPTPTSRQPLQPTTIFLSP
jgi:outer membrane protein TolC